MPSAGFSTSDSRAKIVAGPSATEAVMEALARVLDQPVGAVRSDTVLADIGVDQLARVLLVDACAESGITVDPDAAWSARTVAELLQGVIA